MDPQSLIATGLTPLQAQTYTFLIEHGEVKPPELAKHLHITRTNAYKILDKLVELNLVSKENAGTKVQYAPNTPLALAALAAESRAEATAREEAVGAIMHDLLAKYHSRSDRPEVTIATGRKEVAELYRKQLQLHEDLFFIHTTSDIPMMGFDTMHEIRTTPARYGRQRQAIMTAKSEQETVNFAAHKRSNLKVTWANKMDYSAPVEWSVTESSLLIILYATEPHAILIDDHIVAGAFLQLWKLLSRLLQQQPLHKAINKNA